MSDFFVIYDQKTIAVVHTQDCGRYHAGLDGNNCRRWIRYLNRRDVGKAIIDSDGDKIFRRCKLCSPR